MSAMIARIHLPGKSGAADPGPVMCPSSEDVERWYEERNFPALCAALSQGDEHPHLLQLARNRLERRLAAVSSQAQEIGETIKARNCNLSLGEARIQGEKLAVSLRFVAPWLAGEGSELRRISQAATSASPLNAQLFGVYERLFARRRSAEVFERLTAACGAELSTLGKELLGSPDPATAKLFDAVFIRLGLSCFPMQRFPEILGYAKAEMDANSPLLFVLASSVAGSAGAVALSSYLTHRAELHAQQNPVLEAALSTYLEGFHHDVATGEAARARITCGIALHQSLEEQVTVALQQFLSRSTDVSKEVAGILSRKAPFAKGYHRRVMLSGRSLDQWFGDEPFEGSAFLQAVGASNWVDRKRPEKSPILDLLSFEGPMFGVFTETEQVALRAWLDSVGHEREVATGSPVSGSVQTGGAVLEDADRCPGDALFDGPIGADQSGSSPFRRTMGSTLGDSAVRLTTRQLFHPLVNVEDYPEVLPRAQRYAEHCLEVAARDRKQLRGYFPYRESTLGAWLEKLYRSQMRFPKHRPARPKLSREAYVFGIRQLAPAILVDGCWLQRIEELGQESSGVGRRLFAIYADELGNGNVEHNHPQVYRRLLNSLQIDLPPVDSRAFADHPGFVDAAFDLPAFLLSISLFPRRFLPELLGVNLAIELSGLGAAYSTVARELDYWGIDPQIVRLHQSIDNFASGHAALAKECVILHLNQVRALGGEPTVQDHWRRIWVGYASLRTVTRRFKFALAASYLGRSAWSGVRTAVKSAAAALSRGRTRPVRNG